MSTPERPDTGPDLGPDLGSAESSATGRAQALHVGVATLPGGLRPGDLDPVADADVTIGLWPGRTSYAVGFAFDPAGRVVLIRKRRPVWQAGLLNGVGGHIEPGESPRAAMAREFEEETGVAVNEWDHLASLRFPAGQLWVFRTLIDADVAARLATVTDEDIVILDTLDVIDTTLRAHRPAHVPAGTGAAADDVFLAVANLGWLLPMAWFHTEKYEPVEVNELVP